MSLPNNLLRLWTARIASKLAICSAMTYDLYQLSKARGKDGRLKLVSSDDSRRRSRSGGKGAGRSVEDVFIASLVQAGQCRQHATWRVQSGHAQTGFRGHREHARRLRCDPTVRSFHTTRRTKQTATALPEPPEISSEEYRSLVNIYDSELSDDRQHRLQQQHESGSIPAVFQPEEQPSHIPLAPRLVITPEQEAKPPYTPREILEPLDLEHAARIHLFHRLLQYEPGRLSLPKLWSVYESLPTPRPRYLADDDVHLAFRHLNWIEYRPSEGAMQRYFALLEDCLSEGIPLTFEEWNSAIAFAGRWVRRISTAQVRAAIETWMRMEREGGEGANHVTFNILFDVAVKAGRFALADTIFSELKARKLPMNRYFRTSMIYYQGMRGDGEAVRQAFKDLVDAGEIVDTSVMNCVILSLIRAGEPESAENVFYKMKALVEKKLGAEAVRGWRENRELGRLLHGTAGKIRREAEKHEGSFFGSFYSAARRREEVQKLTPIAPDARTFSLLVRHHAYTSGDIGRIKELLKEMKGQGYQMHGGLYTHIFRGFSIHGGGGYARWSRHLLEEFWEEFLLALSAGEPAQTGTAKSASEVEDEYKALPGELERAPYFTRALGQAAITAFYRCAGKKRMLGVWEQIKDRWKEMGEEEAGGLQRVVERFEGEDAMYG